MGCVILALSAATSPALGQPPRERAVPESGRADMVIAGEGGSVEVALTVRAASLVGFEGFPSSDAQRRALVVTRGNLSTGDGLIRFSTRAACRLSHAEVDMDPERASGDRAARVLSARYRFDCDQPELLDSAALGLFVAFPALQRVFVRYDLDGIRGEAGLNRSRPVVSFVPLQ
jgi:hypothetical protein